MDTKRLILFIVLSFSLLMLWQTWQQEHQPAKPAATAQQSAQQAAQQAPQPAAAAPAQGAQELPAGQTVTVKTDLLAAQISTVGGDIRELQLLSHAQETGKQQPMTLFETKPHVFVAQSGLIDHELPNHKSVYTATQTNYQLQPGQKDLQVALTYNAPNGVHVTKTFTFHAHSYVVDVGYTIQNGSSAPVNASAYYQFLRDGAKPSGEARFTRSFLGAAFYTAQDKFKKEDFSDIAKGKVDYPQQANNGWAAVLQHYFVSAWLPANGVERQFYARQVAPDLYAVGVILPVGTIAAGQTKQVAVPMYAGPEEQDKLKALAPGLNLTVDYGWLTVIAVPLFDFMSFIHRGVGNWGLTIILLTLTIKLLFYPLAAKSYRSMAQMKRLQPKLQRLKEQYGDDRAKLHQAMMEIYQKEKVNPLGGCLPIVIQIPVFIALYWVLLGSVEMRQAHFLWVPDLSSEDPYYILPVIMGITMFLQTKLNPKPVDPLQARMMTIMPLAFTAFFFFSPAGLVVYWTMNNLLSIAQQWYITKSVEKEQAKPRNDKH